MRDYGSEWIIDDACLVLLDSEILWRMNNLCENSDHYRPGLWLASWIYSIYEKPVK